jgi:multidrug efflux pump subunit AcrA (membrane-fusion protein)
MIAWLLAGCGMVGRTPDPLPTVVLESNTTAPTRQAAGQTAAPVAQTGAQVTASGVVVPARQVQVASAQGGNVQAVLVTAGQQVRSGETLILLAGSERLSAAVEAARTQLLVAQQELQKLEENAGQARSAALLRLATANKALDEAKKVRGYRQYRNGSDAMINTARADLILANDRLEQAQTAYNAVSGFGEDNVTKAGALSALSAAEKARDRAVANLNYLTAMPSQIEVDLVEAQLQAAQAEYDAARREVEKLKDGPEPSALALAEQHVKNAQAQLSASQSALQDVALTAPFDATVAEVHTDPGAWVTPGQPLLLLADLSHLQVKTTDLSERDIPAVRLGQPVRVTIKALSVEVPGQVREISSLAESLGGDVVYATTIDLTDVLPTGLRAGMSAEVDFLPGP